MFAVQSALAEEAKKRLASMSVEVVDSKMETE